MSMLSRIYETARIDWRINDLDYPGKDIKLPSPPPNRKIVLAEHQIISLLDECKTSKNTMLYPLVFLLINTGMRPEEAVLLRWNRVCLSEGIIDLIKTKTDPRRIPLSGPCIDMLREFKIEGLFVFISENIARKDKPVRFFRRAFELACIRAGINKPLKRDVGRSKAEGIEDDDGLRVTLYTLRHSAATYLIT